MRSQERKKHRGKAAPLFVGIAACLAFLSGCTIGSKDENLPEYAEDPELSRKVHLGRIVYQQFCNQCHDMDGDGRPFMRGSNLRKVGPTLTPESIRSVLDTGVGEMPAYPNLSDAQKEGVAEYLLRDLLAPK